MPGEARLKVAVSTDAKEASAAFNALAADIKKVGTESVGVTTGVERVDAAMQKLASAPDTPMALARAVAKAKVEIDELRTALDKTPASAAKMGAINAALAKADAAMQTSIARAGKLGEANEEVRQKMGLTAKGAEALGGSFGSLSGIMGKMADSSSVASQNIAKVGFSVMAGAEAFTFGYDMGMKFLAFLDALGIKLPNASDEVAVAAVNMEKFARGTEDTLPASKLLGGTFAEMALKLALVAAGYGKVAEVENASIARARQIIAAKQAQAKAEQDAATAIQKAIPGWESFASQQNGITRAADAASAALVKVTESGGDWRKEVEANQKPLAALVKRIEEKKVALDTLPQPLQDAIAYLKELQGAAKGAVGPLQDLKDALSNIGKVDTMESIDAVALALRRIGSASGDTVQAVLDNAAGLQKLRDEAEKSYTTLDAFRKGVADQLPAFVATGLATQKYTADIDKLIKAHLEYEEARSAANTKDLEAMAVMAALRDEATKTAYAIDSIGDAWVRATGQAAGFTAEVRTQTKTVAENSPEFLAFIERLAGVSDEYEQMIPFVGALIADLEKGRISTAEFGEEIDKMRVGFRDVQGVSGEMFGDLESLFNRLRSLVNEFTAGPRKPGGRGR